MRYVVDTTDKRNLYVYNLLLKNRYSVIKLGEAEGLNAEDTVVFAPGKKLSAQDMCGLASGCTLLCGNVNAEVAEIIKAKHIKYINIMEDEIFAVKNANLTAEGVLAILLKESPRSMFKNNILVIGGGRIALACAKLFNGLSLNFAMVSYNPVKFPRYYIDTQNCYFKTAFLKDLDKFDVIVNTIPNQIFDEETIKLIPQNCLYIETASVPSLDANLATQFNYLMAPALPGKYCFETAGELLYEMIIGENNYEN